MNLYVDDVRPEPEGWAVARTYADAIRMMTRFKYAVVSLDHDLGEAMTGNDIMNAIEQGIVQQPDDVWCHSYNPVERRNIEAGIASWKARRAPSSPETNR